MISRIRKAAAYVLGDFERWLLDTPPTAPPGTDELHENARKVIKKLSGFIEFRERGHRGFTRLNDYANANALDEYFQLVRLGWFDRSDFFLGQKDWATRLSTRQFADNWFETWAVAQTLSKTPAGRLAARDLLHTMRFAAWDARKRLTQDGGPRDSSEKLAILDVVEKGITRDLRLFGIAGQVGPLGM